MSHSKQLPEETFEVVIADIRQESPTVKSFLLDYAQAPFRFLPGQWVDLFVPMNGGWEVGGYSMTSSPLQRGRFQLAVKRAEQHAVTRYLHENARIGERLRVSNGQGSLSYRRGMADEIVLLGAGIGVTPLLSIFRYIVDAVPDTAATLVHSVSTPDELVFSTELEAAAARRENLHYLPTVTGAAGGWHGQQGRINAELIRRLDAGSGAHWFYCGAREFNEAMTHLLTGLGVPSRQLHYEKWW